MRKALKLLAVSVTMSAGTLASAQTLLPEVGPAVRHAPAGYAAYANTGGDPNMGHGSVLDGPAYAPPAGSPEEWSNSCDTCDTSADGACDDSMFCSPSYGAAWFGSVSGLIMTRDRANALWTTYETNNNPNQLMNTQDASAGWAGGAEVTFGHWWCNCGLQFSTFGLATLDGFAGIRDPNNLLSTPLDLTTQVGDILIGARPAGDFFDNARAHSISRRDNIYDVELNYLYQPMGASTGAFQVTWLAGVRYFRFDERLVFGSVAGDGAVVNPGGSEFGNNGGVDEAYLRSRSQNDLVGPQIGAWANWYVTPRFSFFAQPKFGVYGNHMDVRSTLASGDGITAFDYTGSKTDVSFIGEVNLGLTYQVLNNVRIRGGYRAISVSGIALSDAQIPHFLAAADEFQQVDSNGDLILHGAFAGIDWRF